MGMVTLCSISSKGFGDIEAFSCNLWHFGGGLSSVACVTCSHLAPSLQPPTSPAGYLLAITSSHSHSMGKSTPWTCMGVSIFKTLSFTPSHLILTTIPWSWQVRSNPYLTLVRNLKQVTSQPISSAFLHITRKVKRLGQHHTAWKWQDQEEN